MISINAYCINHALIVHFKNKEIDKMTVIKDNCSHDEPIHNGPKNITPLIVLLRKY